MKKRLIGFIVAVMPLLPTGAMTQAVSQTSTVIYLVLTGTDETVHEFALSSNPIVRFDKDSLIIACGEDELATSLNDVKNYSFTEKTVTTAINSISADNDATTIATPSFSFRDAEVTGLNTGDRVSVYNANGMLVQSVQAGVDGTTSLRLDFLPKGIYIIRTPSKSFKITNK